uniref:Zinc finger protein 668 n=1 Tax=Cacopsylla melanoneura TaxID=428564 RepID=A0A8D8S263_9HEMI
MADPLHYIDTFTDLLRQAICLISQMKHEEYILALKQWQIADSMIQSLASQFDVLGHSYPNGLRGDDNDSVDSAKIREQIDLMVEEFPEENEKSSSWTIFNDTFLMFSDEELETIFRKAFIRSKSKNPNEDKKEEPQLIKQDWSNEICDSNKVLTEEELKISDQALIMMSYSDNSNTYTSSSDTESYHTTMDSNGDLTNQMNYVEASINVKTIQQSTTNSVQQKDVKTSLSREHTLLTSLLEQKSDLTETLPMKTSLHSRKSQQFQIPCNSNESKATRISNTDELNVQNLDSNITHMVQNNDMNNLKIEIVMELDKGMANSINSDSKYKIKISPEHFNNIRVNDMPARVEQTTSSVYVESFSATETICSSYQMNATNQLATSCEDTNFGRQKIITNNVADGHNDTIQVSEKKQINKESILREETPRGFVGESTRICRELREDSNKTKDNKHEKQSHSRSRKHKLKDPDDVKFTSAIPDKIYSRHIETSYRKEEKYYKKRRENTKSLSNEKSSKSTKNNSVCKSLSNPQSLEERNKKSEDGGLIQVDNSTNLGESFKIKEIAQQNIRNEDDDIIVLEEKKGKIKDVKPNHSDENEPAITVMKNDTNTLANNNFFLISNDTPKDKQIKYLILNNNNLFKTLNFDGSKIQTNGNMTNSEQTHQTNFLLLNNDKNGNLLILNKDMKQSNYMFNNNGLYNPCETQYFIINDTSSTFQQQVQVTGNSPSPSKTDCTLNYNPSCDITPQPDQFDTTNAVHSTDLLNNCTETYDHELTRDKILENAKDRLMLSQEPVSEAKDSSKDLIQNKENILIVNNQLNEDQFKFDSNDSGAPMIRLDDSIYSLNEKISNELKMGGKCSEIPQIYFINDLDSPLSSDYCVDSDVKDAPPSSEMELLNYDSTDFKNDNSQTVANSDTSLVFEDSITQNSAQSNEKYNLVPTFKPNGTIDNTSISQVKLTTLSQPEQNTDNKPKPVPAKTKLTPLKQNSSLFLKHLKSKLEKQKPVSKNQILNKTSSNYLHKNAPIVKKVKYDDMDSVLTNDPVENASKILALCMKKESEAQQKSLACHICSMVFCDEIVLNKHVEEHSTLGKFTCTVCKKVFNNMKTLKTHSRIHTGEKPFRCSVCGKSFSQRGILSSHLAVHAGVKPHVCKQCGHAFTQKSQLRLHEMRHGNIRHFACNVCPFKFTTKSDLQRHQRSHEGVKPFRCEYCDKTFTRQIILKEHLNRHKGVQPYSCSHCDKTFFDAQSLNKHRLSHKISESTSPSSGIKTMNGKTTDTSHSKTMNGRINDSTSSIKTLNRRIIGSEPKMLNGRIDPFSSNSVKILNGSKLFGGIG